MMFEAEERINVKVEREDFDWSVDDPGTSRVIEVQREPGVESIKGKGNLKRDLFKCDEPNCEYSAENKSSLYLHTAVHSEEITLQCQKCEKNYKKSQNLISHLISHSEETPFQCHECEKAFKASWSQKQHLKLQSEATPFQCDKCERAFKVKKSLYSHKSLHKNREEWYKCEQCDYASPYKKVLKQHETIHVKNNPIKCEQCDYSCKAKRYLVSHLCLKHSAIEQYRCDYPNCQFTTHGKKNYKQHKYHSHESKKPFVCEECQRAFKTKYQLKNHSFVHTSIKPFKCQKCQYSSTEQRRLKVHLQRWHVNEKEHKCDECGASYHSKDDLEKHKLNHNDAAKKFKCHLCPFKTINKIYLTKHLQRRHENKGRFKCDECGDSFNFASDLKKHQLIHSKSKILICGVFDYRTNTPRYLRRHQLLTFHSVSNESSGGKCDQCGLILRDQSDSSIHRDAHRQCSVSLPRLPVSGDVILDVNAPPILRVKIEVNDDDIKKENI